jgi:transposase
VRFFVATQPVDGRKRADSLMVIVRDGFAQDPLCGNLFVFFSKRSDGVSIVYWDRNGFATWSKRLEKSRFHPVFSPDGVLSSKPIEPGDLSLILEGIDLAGARRRPRWEPSAKKSYPMLNP